MNPNDIWSWVEEDIDNRAWYLATFVPPRLFHSDKEDCVAREMLKKYGNIADVRNNFSANYSTELWIGSAVDHYIQKKNALLEYEKNETDRNIILWIKEYLKTLEEDIEQAKISKERGLF
jgi:hypothetical protein